MINLYEKGRSPYTRNEILTRSFLINKIANDMKSKYRKVFTVINYDEYSLRNDIYSLLAKYISNRHKEINIKFIETTILNKVRKKYKEMKTPLKPIKKNSRLIKIINPSPANKVNSFLDLNKKTKTIPVHHHLSAPRRIKNNQHSEEDINENYYTNQENKLEMSEKREMSNEMSNSRENEKGEVNSNQMEERSYNSEELKRNIKEEEDEIKKLEHYKEDIQKQINELDKELAKSHSQNNYNNNNYLNTNNETSINENSNTNTNTKREINESFNSNNLLVSFEQKQYFERKKKIEEDFYNKNNRYMFLKPKQCAKENGILINDNANKNDKYDNIKINKYSYDILNEFNKIKDKIRKEKEEKEFINRSTKNIYMLEKEKEIRVPPPKRIPVRNIPYEEKMKLKALQRSLEQEKAIENLRNILYPQRQLMEEEVYQGFFNGMSEKSLLKKKEYELADKARRMQIEKMKKLLDYSIDDKRKRKEEEKEIDRKYKELFEKEYELYLQQERQKKFEKEKKVEDYRKMLDDQIKNKRKHLIDENNVFEINKDLGLVD